ncbi:MULTISPECIES: ROK family glucokinase [Protofrankia]|uniref:Glucokinase n=1 Tax=Candidatus Protofrankia datiscae TaxID=2716812 RepID=F8B658_9ACTN|nr:MULTISPECIES: ROK family glucokinase [Protofrankia]AEH10462.1 glucokinase, ROK family [Candidatus Protofrankia datiscae]
MTPTTSGRDGSQPDLVIGVDVGGTKVAAGVVDGAGAVLSSLRRPTPSQQPSAVADLIGEVVGELRAAVAPRPVRAVGIGAAGLIDRDRSRVLFAPNLAWRDEPLRDEVSTRTGLPVVVENDANAMAWGEYRFGAGRGEPDLVCVTVGTGVGGGIVLDGRLYRGRFGLGGEIGHMQLVTGGRLCGCGNRGCLEAYGSGNALVRKARELVTTSPTAGRRLLELAGGEVGALTGPAVTEAAREGDPLAVKCFEDVGTWLGRAMASLASILDPGLFVLGGGVSEAGDLLLAPARVEFANSLSARQHRPEARIVTAQLAAWGGIVGAADLTRS